MTAPDQDYVSWGAFEWIVGAVVGGVAVALGWLANKVLYLLNHQGVDNERIKALTEMFQGEHRENKEELEGIKGALKELNGTLNRFMQERPYRRSST